MKRNIGKLMTGPGGMGCPCCTKMRPSKLKPALRRFWRRKDKIDLRKDMNDEKSR